MNDVEKLIRCAQAWRDEQQKHYLHQTECLCSFCWNGRLADAAEAQLKRECEVEVVISTEPPVGDLRRFVAGEKADRIPYIGSQCLFWLGTNAPGRYRFTMHPVEPEPEKPTVRPWRTRPKDSTSRVIDICPECECAISVHAYDGRRCPKCQTPFGEHRDLPENPPT